VGDQIEYLLDVVECGAWVQQGELEMFPAVDDRGGNYGFAGAGQLLPCVLVGVVQRCGVRGDCVDRMGRWCVTEHHGAQLWSGHDPEPGVGGECVPDLLGKPDNAVEEWAELVSA